MSYLFDIKSVCYNKSLNEIHCDKNDEDLFYLESSDGENSIVRFDIKSSFIQTLTTEPMPGASIGYGGSCFDFDKKNLVYCGKDKKLHKIDLKTGVVTRISSKFEGIASPNISPCGRYVTFTGELNDVAQIYICHVDGAGSPVLISENTWFAFNPKFSSDGTKIVWMEWNKGKMSWEESKIVCAEFSKSCCDSEKSYELLPLKIQTLEKPGVSYSAAQFSPDSSFLSFTSDEAGTRTLYLSPVQNICDKKNIIDADFGEIGCPDWVSGMNFYSWSLDSSKIFLIANKNNKNSLLSLNLLDSKIETIDNTYSYFESLCVSKDLVYCVASNPSTPKEIVKLSQKNKTTSKLITSFRGILDTSRLTKPEIINWKSEDGTLLSGVFYPAVKNEKEPGHAPLLVYVHGGPTSQTNFEWHPQAQYFSSRGHSFLYVNHRGSSGFGRKFQDKLRNNWGIVDTEDAKSGAEYLVEIGKADRNKLLICGGSAGGYTALKALVSQSDFWAAGISWYGIGDLFELELGCHRFESNYNQYLIGALPEKGLVWKQRSPLTHVSNVKAPVLLFHGEKDLVVPHQQSIDFARKVTKNGGDCELVLFPDEGHGFRKRKNIKLFYTKIEEFLNKYILCKQATL